MKSRPMYGDAGGILDANAYVNKHCIPSVMTRNNKVEYMSLMNNYMILYEDEYSSWGDIRVRIDRSLNPTLDSYMKYARQLKKEGRRNVRVVESTTAERVVFRP